MVWDFRLGLVLRAGDWVFREGVREGVFTLSGLERERAELSCTCGDAAVFDSKRFAGTTVRREDQSIHDHTITHRINAYLFPYQRCQRNEADLDLLMVCGLLSGSSPKLA